MDDKNQSAQKDADGDSRASAAFWRKWIKNAKDAAKKHHKAARQGWAEYENAREDISSNLMQPLEMIKNTYPQYWASVKTLEPAFYSRTPQLSTKRKFGIKDPVALTASTILERLGSYQVEQSNFDSVMMAAVGDYIHADKATTQIKYEADTEPEKLPVFPADEALTIFMDAEGAIIEGEIFQAPDGSYYYEGDPIAIAESQKISLVPCSFDEILHTPDAQSEDEIVDKAGKFCLLRAEAEKRFPNINPEQIQWKRQKDNEDEDAYHSDNIDTTEEYLEGYECWCKQTKYVYWYSDQYNGLLDKKEDPYHLDGFFPFPPFVIGSKPSKSLFPTPIYLQLYGQIRELHKISEKIPALIDGIRRRAIVDGADEDLITALNSLRGGEYVASTNLKSMIAEGGSLKDSIFFVPVQELVASISELNALTEKFADEFSRFFGLPDIMRGESDPRDAAETVRRQANAGNDRFRYMKKQIRELARDSIELMVDLALYVYSDEKIADIVGFKYMTEQDQQRFPEALAMLRDDTSRVIRIQIETDSMSFVDEHLEAQKMEQVSNLVTGGIQNVTQIMQIDPSLAIVPLNVMLMSLENIGPGRAIMDDIRQGINDMIAEARKAKENPPPPPPDYEQLKIQLKQFEIQSKNELEGAKLQREDFKNQLALETTRANQSIEMIKAQQESYKIQLQQVAEANDLALAQYQLQLDQYKLGQEQQKINLENVVQNFMMQIEGVRTSIEQFKAQGQQAERMQEETRLAQQVKNEGIIGMIDALSTQAQAQQPQQQQTMPPVINIPVTIQAPTQGTRTKKVSLGTDNQATIEETVEEPIPEVDPIAGLAAAMAGRSGGL